MLCETEIIYTFYKCRFFCTHASLLCSEFLNLHLSEKHRLFTYSLYPASRFQALAPELAHRRRIRAPPLGRRARRSRLRWRRKSRPQLRCRGPGRWWRPAPPTIIRRRRVPPAWLRRRRLCRWEIADGVINKVTLVITLVIALKQISKWHTQPRI